jgi:RNA polymerase sigma factor (sigma-70 family)
MTEDTAHLTESIQALDDEDNVDIGQAYQLHAPFIARVIEKLTGAGPHVDDLLQETFIVAYKKREHFEKRSALRTWLYGIATSACITSEA